MTVDDGVRTREGQGRAGQCVCVWGGGGGPLVGSSRKRMPGSVMSSMPIEVRFFSPPEIPRLSSDPTLVPAHFSRPSRLISAATYVVGIWRLAAKIERRATQGREKGSMSVIPPPRRRPQTAGTHNSVTLGSACTLRAFSAVGMASGSRSCAENISASRTVVWA